MNKTMQSMMKPIRVNEKSKPTLKLAQEQHVLDWLRTVDHSVNCREVSSDCKNIPGAVIDNPYHSFVLGSRQCSAILKRLERKGSVVSVLYGSYRYYSIPVEG